MPEISPSVAALQAKFGTAVRRAFVTCGDTVVVVDNARVHEILGWLKTDPAQQFNYLTDITAVEYRDRERPLEVVWQLRSLSRKADLRLKVELVQGGPLRVDS